MNMDLGEPTNNLTKKENNMIMIIGCRAAEADRGH